MERIVEAAIELADAEGLEAVTMAAVAKRCGFTTMSLYRHVASKEDLVSRMLDTALGPAPAWEVPDWRAGLETWARALLDLLLAHPWAIDVPITGVLHTESQVSWLDGALGMLAGTPLGEGEKAEIALVLNGYLFWTARLRRSLPAEPVDLVPPAFDLGRYPHVAGLMAAGEEASFEEDFRFGLDLILDGVEARIQRSSPRPVPPSLPRTSSK